MKRSLKLSKSPLTDSSSSKRGKLVERSEEDGETRRYRFRSFNDRIEDVDISSIQKIGGYRGTGPESADTTWFELSLFEWQELNCTAAFARFAQQVRPLMGTLAFVLFNREAIMEAIFKILKEAADNPDGPARLALVPVFSLTAMLAKDLGPEFMPFFADYFALVAPVLPSAADAEVIEAAFASLLYVFKCLLPQLISNIPAAFDLVLKPLFASTGNEDTRQAAHLRKFAAQSCGYLLRKASQLRSTGFFQYVEASPATWIPEFVADALFSAIFEEQSGKLRTCLKPLLLEILAHLKENNTSCWSDILRFTAVKLVVAGASDPTTSLPLWRIFVQVVAEADADASILAPVLTDAFAFRFGSRVQLHREFLAAGLGKLKSVEAVAYFLRSLTLELTLQNRQAVIKVCEDVCQQSPQAMTLLIRYLAAFEWPHYKLVLADVVSRVLRDACAQDADFLCLLEAILDWQGSSGLNKFVDRLAGIALLESDGRALNLLVSHFVTLVPEALKLKVCREFGEMLTSGRFERSRLRAACALVSDFSVPTGTLKAFITNELACPEQLDACRVVLQQKSLELQEELIPLALPALRSHCQEWRLAALRLLQILLKETECQNILSILESIESVPADLQNV